MEQATDALKMAFAVLVFVIALGVGINAFTEAKQTMDVLISNADRETEYENLGDSAYIHFNDGTEAGKATTRYVNAETIIPTIYRAYKENYKIIFAGEFQKSGWCLYRKAAYDETTGVETSPEPVYEIDLEKVKLFAGSQEEFLNGILFHRFEKEGEYRSVKDTSTILFRGNVNERSPHDYFCSTYAIKSIRGST